MALRDFFRIKRKQLDTSHNLAGYSLGQLGGMLNFLAQGPEDEIVHLLNSCEISGEDPSPQQWRKLSKILYNNLSVYERAINLHSTLLGKVQIPKDIEISERTRGLCESFISTVPVLAEYQPHISDVKGLNNLVRQMVIDVLNEGMSFSQDRFLEIEGILTEEYLGVMQFDPESFDFGSWGKDLFLHLVYLNEQYPRLDENGNVFDNPFFHVLKLESDHKHPWGVPLIRGGKMLADTFVAMIVAIKLQTLRFANPASFNLVQVKDTNRFLNDKQFQDLMVKAVKQLQENVQTALRNMNKGKPQELVNTIPGEIDLESKIFGEGFNNFIDHNTLWKIAVLFCNVLGVPPALLGIKTTGSGIGSDEFQFAYKLLIARISSIREAIRPILIRIVKNYLTSLRVSPSEIERIDISFADADLVGEKEKAEIGKIEAERMSLLQAMYTEIRMTDPDEARAFAEQNRLFTME